MHRQSKLDLLAASAIATMFLGAIMLKMTPLGLPVIAAGFVAMLVVFLATLRRKS